MGAAQVYMYGCMKHFYVVNITHILSCPLNENCHQVAICHCVEIGLINLMLIGCLEPGALVWRHVYVVHQPLLQTHGDINAPPHTCAMYVFFLVFTSRCWCVVCFCSRQQAKPVRSSGIRRFSR